jgi:uncharacterized surface protein with fasciclin (FAS1) repeats
MTNRHPLPRSLLAAAALALLPLTACSQKADGGADGKAAATPAPSDETLAAELAKTDDLSKLNDALRDTGLSQVFDNGASYTIFAPTDAAFDKLGDTGKALMSQDQRAVLTAVLRDHIVPGYLTPDDIGTAIDAQGGKVNVRTMGDHKLTFTRDGTAYRVTSDDGSTALIAGDPVTASDGVAIPVDGVLKKPPAAG